MSQRGSGWSTRRSEGRNGGRRAETSVGRPFENDKAFGQAAQVLLQTGGELGQFLLQMFKSGSILPSKTGAAVGKIWAKKLGKGAPPWNKLAVNWAKFWDGVLVREHAPIKNWSCTGQFFCEKLR